MTPKLISSLLILLFFISCNKNDDDAAPLEQLPEATQTGEQTMGCLINGEPWTPRSFGQGRLNAFYQWGGDGLFTLGISGSMGGGFNKRALNIGCIDRELIEEQNYSLIEIESGNYFGGLSLSADDGIGNNVLTTTSQNPGRLTITFFDPDEGILAGTFEFTVVDEDDGTVYEITEGRFDVRYTN